MDNLHFILNNILTNFFKELTKYKNDYQQYLNYIYIYIYIHIYIYIQELYYVFFFFKDFQLMASAPNYIMHLIVYL